MLEDAFAQTRNTRKPGIQIKTSEPSIRLYNRDFFLAMASQVCFVVANSLLIHYARWIEHLGGDLSDVGYINGAGVVLGLIIRPWLGQWINRLGAKTLWLTGNAVFAISSIANLLLFDIGAPIYLARSGILAGVAIVFSSALAYITQVAPDHRRTEAIGILGAGGFIGMLLGPYLGDWFLGPNIEGAVRDRSAFTNLFVFAAFANIVPMIFLAFLRPVRMGTSKAPASLMGFFSTVKRFWPGPVVSIAFVFGVCVTVPFVFLASYVDETPLIIGQRSVIGIFFLGYAGWGFTLRVLWRRLPELIGTGNVLSIGTSFMTVGMIAYVLVDESNAWMIIAPALLTGTGHSLMFHSVTSLTIESFPRELRGTGSVLVSMIMEIGMFIGAIVLGIIGEHLGFNWLFSTIGIACAACAIPLWLMRNR